MYYLLKWEQIISLIKYFYCIAMKSLVKIYFKRASLMDNGYEKIDDLNIIDD